MTEERYLKLTDTLYKVIEFLPEEEPLKRRIKERALEIMENLILISVTENNPHSGAKEKISNQIGKDIEILKNFLKLGKMQGWMDNMNFFILIKEYDKIKDELRISSVGKVKEEETAKEQTSSVEKTSLISEISERQKKILEILKEQGKAQVSDFKKIFANVSKRTLRRDLDDLLKKEKIVRAGEWNQIFYKLI